MNPPGLSQAAVNPRPASSERVLVAHVVAPVPVGLLDPERVEGVVAGVPEAERLARVDDRVVDVGRELGRDVQLPAQLADVGDARGPDEARSPRSISRAVPNGNAAFDRSASVTDASSSRERGPMMPMTASAEVTSVDRDAGIRRGICAPEPVQVAHRLACRS